MCPICYLVSLAVLGCEKAYLPRGQIKFDIEVRKDILAEDADNIFRRHLSSSHVKGDLMRRDTCEREIRDAGHIGLIEAIGSVERHDAGAQLKMQFLCCGSPNLGSGMKYPRSSGPISRR